MKQTQDHFDARNQAMLLRGAYLLMHRRFNAIFEPLTLTADQFVLLSLLKGTRGCTQRELADRSFADVNTLGAMLRLLERRKLVRRIPHSTDRRANSVSLTKAGERLRAKCEEASLRLLATLNSCFAHNEQATKSLSQMIKTMSR